MVVAFSGGADSAFLAWVAHDTLGPERALAVTAVSPSLAGERAGRLRRAGRRVGPALARGRDRRDGADAAYRRNDGDRCYWCKDALMDAVGPLAAADGRPPSCSASTSTTSATTGPASGRRPSGARVPAGRRRLHQGRRARRGRGGWACARGTSRPPPAWRRALPYGTPVTLGVLGRVERAEAALRALGLRRRCGSATTATSARLEVPLDRPGRRRGAAATRWSPRVRAAGYRYVTLDLEGLRSGNLNAALARRRPRLPSS